MNYNPLLIKSFIMEKVPILKEKSLSLYSKYLSDGKFSSILKSIPGNDTTETISAYTLGLEDNLNSQRVSSEGKSEIMDLVFDEGDVSVSKAFSEKEWVMLGMLLRAYKEVENIDLMHLYNCLYKGSDNKVYGHVVIGKTYTLYGYTQLPIGIKAYYGDEEIPLYEISDNRDFPLNCKSNKYMYKPKGVGVSTTLDKYSNYVVKNSKTIKKFSLSSSLPLHFSVDSPSSITPGTLVNIEISFAGSTYQQLTLVEGVYRGIFNLYYLTHPKENADPDRPIPEPMQIGQYSRKLVEFVAGTLVTKLSDTDLIESIDKELTSEGKTFSDRVKNSTLGIYNKDGYCDRRIKV